MKYLNRTYRLALALAVLSAAESEASTAGGAVGEAPAAPKAPGVGDVAKDLIRQGLGNKEVLAQVREQFPEAKTTMSSINWYRNHLRGLGEAVKTARELASAGKPSKEELKAQRDAAKAEAKAKKDAEKAEAKAKKDAEKAEAKAKKDAEKAEAKAKKAAEKKAAVAPAGEPATEGGDQAFLG